MKFDNSHAGRLFLMGSESMMAEYGYRYQDPETGIFWQISDRTICIRQEMAT